MNANLLRSKMALHGDMQVDLAKELNITAMGLSNKMNQKTDFKQSEIDFISKKYDLTADEIKEIFFSN